MMDNKDCVYGGAPNSEEQAQQQQDATENINPPGKQGANHD